MLLFAVQTFQEIPDRDIPENCVLVDPWLWLGLELGLQLSVLPVHYGVP